MEGEKNTEGGHQEVAMKEEIDQTVGYLSVATVNKSDQDLQDSNQNETDEAVTSVTEDNINSSENATPLSLDAIPPENHIVKSTEQEVINMLLAQHGIIPNSGTLDVPTFTTQHSPALRTASVTSENSEDSESKDMVLPTMVSQTGVVTENVHPDHEVTEDVQSSELNPHSENVEPGSAYLSSINASEIVTTFVTDDGQGGHIIIAGGTEYQDNGVVTMTGRRVSRVAEGQLMTIASGENVPVSMPALDTFGTEHVQIGPATDGEDESTTTSFYVLEDHVAMVDGQSHMDANDQEVAKKVYQCTMEGCGKQFSTPYRLKAHGRSHTGHTFTCEEDGCNKTFITHSDLNKHARTHSGDKTYYCDFEGCGKVYSTSHHLKVHKRSHTGDKPFVCKWETCGKSFSTGYGLKSHFRTHTGERPYKCPEDSCEKAFKTSGDLQKHVRTHTGERPFQCPYEGCGRSFTTSNIRKVHLRTHTGERPYVCEFEGCNRSFASATNYKNHSRIHTGERPYACEVPGCNKSFTEYSSLYKHNVVHTQQKPYICTICHKTYRQTSTLAMHKRTVHGASDDGLAENDGCQDDESSRERQPPSKRQKIAFDSNVSLTTALVQGLPVMLNDEGTMTALQSHYAELAAQQQITDGSALSGAIAIPIQVTMNPDGTIAGAHGINLTDNNGRLIPVSLSLSLPISSSFATTMQTSNSHDSIATSEAAAAASAVHEIFSNQQTDSSMDVQLNSAQVITEPIENTEIIKHEDEHSESKDSGSEPIIANEGIGGQILITAVSDTHVLMSSDSDATSVRIAPRDYTSSEAGLKNIDGTQKGGSESNTNSDAGSATVTLMIQDETEQEHDEGDVTDRYLIKESDVRDKT